MSGLFEKIPLKGVKNIITVASGKGGVGKSTVSVNLALTLVRNGYRTALVDADIYGPSIPKMLAVEKAKPEVMQLGDQKLIVPVEKYGLQILSVGFFVDPGKSLIWRGPMASQTLKQLFEETYWGELDYMIIDFPPGTGDIQLTAAQKLNLHGALIVTTPQEVSLIDARKAASMFAHQGISVPLLGVVENMSWFSPALHPDEKYYIFGQGGGQKLANELKVPLLGQIPLVMEIGQAADTGKNIYQCQSKEVISAFEGIASGITSL